MRFVGLLTSILVAPSVLAAATPQAFVYRGPAACNGCPESLGRLLRTSPTKFNVSYIGPNEHIKFGRNSLSKAQLYAQPGGGGISKTWPHMKPHYDEVRDFVANGGLYLGTCLGAYFAATPGFDLLGHSVEEEELQPHAQVQSRKNTIIQVNWHFNSGELAGTTEMDRWLFFQDGAVIAPKLGYVPNATVLARYSSNGDLAAVVKDFGKGRIGIVGPHPEAGKGWYTPYNIHNPDGINFKYGWDLVESLWHGPKTANEIKASRPSKSSHGSSNSNQHSIASRSTGVPRVVGLYEILLALCIYACM